MNNKIFYKSLRISVLLLFACFLSGTNSFALDLAAVEAEWTPPGSTTAISMWGFIEDSGSCPVAPVAWTPGPDQIVAAAGNSLSITLRNCLSEPVSIVIPGQPAILNPQFFTDGQGRTRAKAFTHEAAAGSTAVYTWTNLKAGTFLYQSGSHPAKQVQMGLYGALKVGTYSGLGIASEVTLLFSEIDPALHVTLAGANPLNYIPRYFLINGESYSAGQPVIPAGMVSTTTLIRFLNAGLMSHTPIVEGPYMSVIAEDGNLYPYAREQYAAFLPAGKTLDALWSPTEVGSHAVYDRSLSMSSNGAVGGGMQVFLYVAPAGSVPVAEAGPDQSGVALNSIVTLTGSSPNSPVTYNWSLISVPAGSAALLTGPATTSPTFVADVAGSYVAQLVVNDGVADSLPDAVIITTNSVPIADAGPDQDQTVGNVVILDGTGSSDADLEPLTYSWIFNSRPVGSLAFLTGQTTDAPTFTADAAGDYVVQLVVNDGNQNSAPDVVTITVSSVNAPPTAVNDGPLTVQQNSRKTNIDVLLNDIAGDGVIDPATIVVTTGRGSTEGGRVSARGGVVRYRPPSGFVGTDTFNYTVKDDLGLVSNEATVTINVVVP